MVLRQRVDCDRTHLERTGALLSAGAVWPLAITRYKLAHASKAHRASEGRGWDVAAYRRTVDILRATLPHLAEGREGFVPV